MTETDTGVVGAVATAADTSPTSRALGLRWWREVIYVVAFYGVYSFIRNTGVRTDSARVAFIHAKSVIRVERLFGMYHEETIQDLFLGWHVFIQFWNVFYGSAHFIVTTVALVYMFKRMPQRYARWRNTLAITTGLALIGFAFFPLMPPRLLPAHYGFVDTLQAYGGLWSFDSGAMAKVSNQYAAMPSLHCAWAMWSAFVLYPAVRRKWARVFVVVYPCLTVFAIVVTANHYVLDALGGAATLLVGYILGSALAAKTESRRAQKVA